MSAQLLRCCCGAACCAHLLCGLATGSLGASLASLSVTGTASLEVYDSNFLNSGPPVTIADEDATWSGGSVPQVVLAACSSEEDTITFHGVPVASRKVAESVVSFNTDLNVRTQTFVASEWSRSVAVPGVPLYWFIQITQVVEWPRKSDGVVIRAYTYELVVRVDVAEGARPCARVMVSRIEGVDIDNSGTYILVPATVSVDNAGQCPSVVTLSWDGGGGLRTGGTDYVAATGLLVLTDPNVSQCGSGELGPGCTGACCDAGVCSVTDEATCEAGDGVWHGGGTDCGDIECGSTGPGVNPSCCNTRCAANTATVDVEYDVLVRITRRACCANNRVDGTPVEASFVDSETINLGTAGCQDISAIIELGTITLPNPCGGSGTIVETVELYVESSCALVRPGLTRPLTSVEVSVGTQAGGGARVLSAAYVRFESDNEGGPTVINCPNAVPDDFFAYRVEIFGEIRLVGRGEC